MLVCALAQEPAAFKAFLSDSLIFEPRSVQNLDGLTHSAFKGSSFWPERQQPGIACEALSSQGILPRLRARDALASNASKGGEGECKAHSR